ncbi:inner membrane protein PPF-1, chloroplastic isoform X2 [Cryptomeria japonica]|uniref:inner membrane protein PPF-1, chloroplastic isoform X2 n=1 Tax=Cryptomeria japonica TaxID=3369 RepID=UPI0025ABA87E|nr:inner membrane protein PPF-1, chloroplastic isoform X2 [Cryptomeria japonica]
MNAGVCSYPHTHGPSICRRCILQSHTSNLRKAQVVRVSSSLHQVPQFVAPAAVQGFINRAEALLYTLADAAVATQAATSTDTSTATATESVQKQSGDWFSGITNVLEGFLKVESTMAIQNLQPKIKAIQQKYAGNQEMVQLETAKLYKQAGVNPLAGCLPTLATIPVWIGLYRALSNVANEGLLTEGFFWIPSLAGPTTIAARQNGSGISWLFPFVDGHPPLGWSDTLAYLVLPVLLIVSQYISTQIMQPPQANDPNQKSTQAILKFLPLMIGYFSLSVPSGLSLYWLTNNILSTGQQVWLRKLGGAKPVVDKDFDVIKSMEELTTPKSQLVANANKPPKAELVADPNKPRRGDRFKNLKEEELRRKREREEAARKQANTTSKALDTVKNDNVHNTQAGEKPQIIDSLPGSDDVCIEDEAKSREQVSNSSAEKEGLGDGLFIDNGNGKGATSVNSTQNKNKQSKQKGAA